MNHVSMVGNLTKDVELRRTTNGTPVATFTIALNRFGAKERQQTADFINCIAWNKTAELIAQYCGKGSKIGAVGRLQSRSYQDNNRQNRYVTEVVCDTVEFLTPKQETQQQNSNKYQQTQNANAYMNSFDINKDFDNSMSSFDIMDDDIQF